MPHLHFGLASECESPVSEVGIKGVPRHTYHSWLKVWSWRLELSTKQLMWAKDNPAKLPLTGLQHVPSFAVDLDDNNNVDTEFNGILYCSEFE